MLECINLLGAAWYKVIMFVFRGIYASPIAQLPMNRSLITGRQIVPDSWSSDTESSVAQSSAGPRDDADVGVGRTKMTAPRVIGDELTFLRG